MMFASNPAWTQTLMAFGTNGTAHGNVHLDLNNAGKVLLTDGTTATGVSGALTTNTWHHVMGTYDGVTLTLYVDGSSVATAASTVALPGSSYLSFGALALSSASQYFAGTLDEMSFWTVALPQIAISHLAQIGANTFTLTAPSRPTAPIMPMWWGRIRRYAIIAWMRPAARPRMMPSPSPTGPIPAAACAYGSPARLTGDSDTAVTLQRLIQPYRWHDNGGLPVAARRRLRLERCCLSLPPIQGRSASSSTMG